MRKIIFIVLLLLSFAACKRFDSNAYNQKMIQGNWILNDIWSKKDSTSMQIQNSSTLIFVKNICTEHYTDSLNRDVEYKFEINNYHLRLTDNLQKKNSIFLISKLVKDSLILENDSYFFAYIQTKE